MLFEMDDGGRRGSSTLVKPDEQRGMSKIIFDDEDYNEGNKFF